MTHGRSLIRLVFLAALTGDIACVKEHTVAPPRSFSDAVIAATEVTSSGFDKEQRAEVAEMIAQNHRECLTAKTARLIELIESRSRSSSSRGYLRLTTGYWHVGCDVDARLLEPGILSALDSSSPVLTRTQVVLLSPAQEQALRSLSLEPAELHFHASDTTTWLYGLWSESGWQVVVARRGDYSVPRRDNLQLDNLIFDLEGTRQWIRDQERGASTPSANHQ